VTAAARGSRRRPRRLIVAVLGVLALAAALPAYWISSRAAGSPSGQLRITSGATKGVYNSFATELANHLQAHDHSLRVSVQASTGSVENLTRIAAGVSDCGFTAGDAAALAIAGTRPFTAPLPIQAIARVYDDYIHLVVRADSAIKSVADLRGKLVSLGSSGSGVQLISGRVLQTAKIAVADLHPLALGINESIEAMTRGQIDAFFWSGGLPTRGVAELAKMSPIRLVPLGDLATTLDARYADVYRPATIPAGTYGLTAPLSTVAVANFLVCNSAVSPAISQYLTRTLFDSQSAIAAIVPPVNAMDRRTAIATDPVPLHPGALRWYRQTKN
jgi:TRAP transporter TAXI family solute receptor